MAKKRNKPGIPGSGKNPWSRLRRLRQSLTGSAIPNHADTAHSPDMRELEPRILYSAAPIGDFSMNVDGAHEMVGQDFFEAVDQQIEAVDIWSAADLEGDSILISADDFGSAADDFASESPQNTEIVFLDSNIEDFESLYQSLFEDAATGNKFEVYVLDANQDGIQQISQILDNRSDVSGVHIVSHGSDGSVQLGNTSLNSNNLSAYAASVASWADALTSEADILFYGCDLASSTQGEEFIESISELTGADVTASDDATGSAELGGDWEFEYRVGIIETSLAFSHDAQNQWHGLLNIYSVTNTLDDGSVGSLRWAIARSNASTTVDDTINFNISGTGVHTINVGSSLTITDTVTINGLSEPDYASTPVVQIDGAAAGFSGISIEAGGEGSTIQGLMITGFTADGIRVASGANNVTIADNWIGTAGIGTTGIGNSGVGNSDDGIDLAGSNAIIVRNVITNSGDEGITIVGSGITGHIIQGNYIGLDPDGLTASGNTDVGLAIISGSGNTIGGTTAAAGNVISNNFEGIEINTSNNVVQGNYIGTDSTGTLDRGNRSDDGIELQNGASGNQIGGMAAGAGNVIAANYGSGILITGNGTTDNIIQGNFIGTDASGTVSLGNHGGITVANNAADNLIGGTITNTGNVIAFNDEEGVTFGFGAGSGNSILGNSIYSNTRSGIDLGDNNGVTPNDLNDADSGGNDLQNFPVVTQAIISGTNLTVSGTLDTDGANTQYRIEFYGNVAGTGDATHGEGRYYLGSTIITTNAMADGTFSDVVLPGVTLSAGDSISATATKVDSPAQVDNNDLLAYGSTSEFSANIAISTIDYFQTVPIAQTTNEDTPLVFSSSNGNAIVISDQSVNDSVVNTRLAVANGTLSLGSLAGITFVNGSSDGTGTLDITGTESAINAALENLTYTPSGDFNGSDSLTIATGGDTSSDIQGSYTFEGGDASDDSGNGNDGTVFGAAAEKDLQQGIVMNFAAGDYVQIPGRFGDPQALTLAAWVNLDAGQTNNDVISLGDVVWLRLDSVVGMQVWTKTDTGTYGHGSFQNVAGTGWRHVAATIDVANNQIITYVDGVQALTFGFNGTSINWSATGVADTFIGQQSTGSNSMVGDIDDIVIYDRALNAGEIAALRTGHQLTGNSVDITINPVNDAPTVNDSLVVGLPGTDEDSATAGTTVSAIVNNAGWNDLDSGAVRGMAVTAVAGNGTWQYSTDGSTWQDFGTPSATNALLLDGSTQVRFVGDGVDGEVATFSFKAWDQTNGTASTNGSPSYLDPGFGGGDTAFSSETAMANTTVTSVNDAPTATIVASSFGVNEDESYRPLAGFSVSDVDAGVADMAVALKVNQGQINLTDISGLTFIAGGNDTATMTITGSVTDLNNALSTLTYRPNSDFSGTDTITLEVDDQGNSGGGALAGIDSADIVVAPVNDAPIQLTGTVTNLTVGEDSGLTPLGLAGITYGPGGGADESAQSLTIEIMVIPDPNFFGKIFLADGTTQVVTGTYLLSELQGMQFQPEPDVSGGPSFFQWRIVDDGGVANGGQDSFSQFILLNIDPVNDSPTVATNTGLTVNDGDTGTIITSAMLNEGDVDDSATGITYTLDSVPVNGRLFLSGSQMGPGATFTQEDIDFGRITYDHNGTPTTSDSFNFTISDGGEDGSTPVSDTFLITITQTNTAPTITTTSLGVAENQVVAGTILANDPDLPADTLTWSLTGSGTDDGLFSIDSSTGELSFITIPDFESPDDQNGDNVYEVDVQVFDGAVSTIKTITVTVTPVNDNTPDAGLDFTANLAEESADGTFVGTIIANDVDLPGDVLSYVITGGDPLNGFAIDSSGNITISDASVLDLDFDDGTDLVTTLTVTVDDGTFNDTVNVTVRVTPVNDISPDAGLDFNANVVEESANNTLVGTVSASDVDLPGDAISYAITGGDPFNGFSIDSSGNITISDAAVLDLDFDDGSDLVATLTITVDDGTFSDTVDVTVRVTPVNDNTPNAGLDFTANVAEESANGTFVGSVAASDIDLPGDAITYAITDGDPLNGFAIDSSGNITISDAAVLDLDFDDGSDLVATLTITVDDGTFSDTVDVMVRVTPVNDNAPAFTTPSTVNVVENSTAVMTVNATDADLPNQTVTYSISGGLDAALFSINANTGELTFNASPDYEAPADSNGDNVYEVEVTGNDNVSLTTAQTILVNVTPVNDNAPDAGLDFTATVAEESANGTLVGSVAASDIDLPGDALTYAITGGDPLNGFAIDSSGNITISDAAVLDLDFDDGADLVATLTITVDDGTFNDTVNVTVRVTPTNDNAPDAGFDFTTSVSEESANGAFVAAISASDTDLPADTLTWAITGGDPLNGFSIDSTGIITISDAAVLDLDFDNGTDLVATLTVTVSDGINSDTVDVTVRVTPINEAPVLTNAGATLNEGGSELIDATELNATDIDNLPAELVYTVTTTPTNGFLAMAAAPTVPITSFTQADIDAGQLTYVHDGSETTSDQFFFDLTDGSGATLFGQRFDLNVHPLNDAPVANLDSYGVNEDQILNGSSVLANDSDVDSAILNAQLVSGPANADLFVLNSDGTFTYTPTADYFGTDSFQYQASDGAAVSATTTVTINVNSVNDLPQGHADSYVAIGNEALTELASVLANDGDVENDALVAILVSNPANGNVRLAADGTFVYTPDSGFVGSDSFTYMPNDGSGNGTLTTVTIEVDAPGGGPPDGRDDGDGVDGGKKGNDDPDDDNDTDPAVDGFQLPTPRDISGDTADDRPGSSKNLKSLDLDNLLGGEISKQNLPDQQQATDILEWMVAQQAARDNASDNDDASARVSGITFAFNASQLWEELDRLADEVADNLTFDINSTTTIAITTITATAGYIIWSLRGGFLMATLVSSLPTWSHIDPLPVLESRVAVRNSRAIDATERLFD